ncbi:MAG: biotin carboxylase N-terminal domain-containing protein [Candidatus Muiribacteriota bacterium]
MYKKILIANRGNIAVNIIKACSEMGIQTVTVFSDVDKEGIHTRYADKAYYLGRAKFNEDYNRVDKIIDVALKEKVDAVHPGFGFLAQNFEFLNQCKRNNIDVIGVDIESLEFFTDKLQIKNRAEELKIPVINGKKIEEKKDLKNFNYPVLLKPVCGFAGRGIQYCENYDEACKKLEFARREAEYLFDNNEIYAEEYIDKAYLLEISVAGDGKNNVSLPLSDSSLRRNFQKIVSECPAEYIDKKIRKKIKDYTKKLANNLKIKNIGNFEFIVYKKEIFFLEFNPRLPLNYGVLEMITGYNLIKEQINLSCYNKITIEEKSFDKIQANAFECRINAENYFKKFQPCTGIIKKLVIPGGKDVRVEFDYYNEEKVSSYYDSQIAKVIVKTARREEMVNKIRWVLRQTKIKGIFTTLPFIYNVVNTKMFRQGKIVSDFVTHVLKERKFKKVREKEYIAAVVASLAFYDEDQKRKIIPKLNKEKREYSPWSLIGRKKSIKKWE